MWFRFAGIRLQSANVQLVLVVLDADRIDNAGIVISPRKVHDPRLVVDKERVGPGSAAVVCAINAPLLGFDPVAAEAGEEGDVRVVGIDENAWDLLTFLKAGKMIQVLPASSVL